MRLAAWRLAVDIRSAWRMVSHWIHSTFWRSLREGTLTCRALVIASMATASREIVDSVVNTTARSMVFSSSRTFPGQWYAWSDETTSSSSASINLPVRAACLCTRYSASMGISSARSRSGGTTIGITSGDSQIVLEPTLVYELTEVAVGRRNHTDIHLLGPIRTKRLDFPFLQDTQQLGLKAASHRANLIEEYGALVGKGKLAFLVVVASVNAPLTCPKSSDSRRLSGIAAQFTLTNGMLRCALR